MNGTIIENLNIPNVGSSGPLKLEDAVLALNSNLPLDRYYQPETDYQQNIVGWDSNTASFNYLVRTLFSDKTINVITQKVSDYLQGVSATGKRIVPSRDVVMNSLNAIYQHYLPRIGDIYGRYLVVDQQVVSHYDYIVDQTISQLVSSIRTHEEMAQQNWKLNIWDSILLGDDNPQGLRQHAPIKLREKGPDRFLFNMRY